MGYFLSILVFIFLFPLLGWSFQYLIKLKLDHKPFLEKYLIFFGIGLGIFPLLTIILNFLHIPLTWWMFLILALIVPIINIPHLKFYISFSPGRLFKKFFGNLQFLLMFLIFMIVLFVMLKGAFVYDYLEDDDSWSHSLAAKYISVEKNLNPSSPAWVIHYLDPYPPAYPALMGILHQTNNSIYWTLKFFNAIIVALTIPFFYLFSNLFFQNKNKALFSTFLLASIPCFLSHFIWAHSLVILFMLIAFYWMLKINKEKKALFILPVIISAVFFTQITQSIKFGILFFAFFVFSSIFKKKIDYRLFLSGFFGLLLSLLWWGFKINSFYEKASSTAQAKYNAGIFNPHSGTASKAYTAVDFLFPQKHGLMTNPVGIGWIICILAIIGIIATIIILFRKSEKKEHALFALFFTVFAFLGVNSITFNLPVGLFAFRFWMLLAISVSLLATYGLYFLIGICKKIRCSRAVPIIIFLVIVIVLITAAYPKYSLNTAFWAPGTLWTGLEEIDVFLQLKQESKEQRIFSACKRGFQKIIGNDQFGCAWCKDEIEFQNNFFSTSSSDISLFLKSHNYAKLLVEHTCLEEHTSEELGTKINELLNSGLFGVHSDIPGMIIFNVPS